MSTIFSVQYRNTVGLEHDTRRPLPLCREVSSTGSITVDWDVYE